MIKEIHHFIGHHHEGGIECEANGLDRHIHDSEIDFAQCLICSFNFSPTKEVAEIFLALSIPSTQVSHFFDLKTVVYNIFEFLPDLRGPPTFL